MKSRRKNIGKLLFLIPTLVVLALVLVVVFLLPTQGNLDVSAMSFDKYTGRTPLSVEVTVGTQAFRTPANLTLSPGSYTVTFPHIQWYTAPPSHQVEVAAGRTVYAVGQYTPTLVEIAATPTGFNATVIQSLHGVTPVVWIDASTSFVTISIESVGRVNLNPGQNFTYIFPSPGRFVFQLYDAPSVGGVVDSV